MRHREHAPPLYICTLAVVVAPAFAAAAVYPVIGLYIATATVMQSVILLAFTAVADANKAGLLRLHHCEYTRYSAARRICLLLVLPVLAVADLVNVLRCDFVCHTAVQRKMTEVFRME